MKSVLKKRKKKAFVKKVVKRRPSAFRVGNIPGLNENDCFLLNILIFVFVFKC